MYAQSDRARSRTGGGATKQTGVERRGVQLDRQRPAEPALRRPLQVIPIDRPHADGARLGHRLVGQPPLVLEP